MTTKKAHTPLPWEIGDRKKSFINSQGKVICELTEWDTEANASFIVKCVNNHERLVEACKEFVQWFDYLSAYQHENLVNNQTLESASENWESMTISSPPIDKMRDALKQAGE